MFNEASQNILSILSKNASLFPNKIAYTFLNESNSTTITNNELLHLVNRVATHLLKVAQPGFRALLLLPPGIDYIYSFLGCLRAGVIAVPAYPPRNNRHAKRVELILQDAEASVVITTEAIKQQYSYEKVKVLTIDGELKEAINSKNNLPLIAPDQLAFLQYTSGSTGNPKGVMISHGNILANTSLSNTLLLGECKTLCSWLPPFHDMGLIGAILFPLAYNMHSVLIAPTTFLKSPFFWLKAISDFQANIAPAPNFAYELCLNAITDEQKKLLDLKHWIIALNGAEPVNARTIERFSQSFKGCGFQAEFFYPAYGMAETTLMVSGKRPRSDTKVLTADKISLQENHEIKVSSITKDAIPLVGCGFTTSTHEIKIIDPKSLNELEPLQIGEIVISGPSVAQGYWKKADLSQDIFELTLSNSNKKYLRTGDLGFLDNEGELFVTGRLKDLIIIRGHNIYPQDIESMIHECHSHLIQQGCAAFTLDIQDNLELVIVQEVHRRAKNYDEIFDKILRRCGEDLPVLPAKIILIQERSLPKTSSGKVQRSACRQAVINGELKVITQWNKASKLEFIDLGCDELEQWMRQWFATQLRLPIEKINPQVNFAYYGVDSSLAVQFCGALEKFLLKEINPSLLWTYSTISQLAEYLKSNKEQEGNYLENSAPEQSFEPIAIIGMSCRFPGGVNNPEDFWTLLKSSQDGIQEVPPTRWDSQLYRNHSDTLSKIATSRGGFIDNIDAFDANLFNICRREAESMDPQHRLLLELSWEALERANIAPMSLKNTNTGVFVGISSSDYGQLIHDNMYSKADAYYGIGNAHSASAGRISYFFGTHGESMAVDTACSSSLVAVFNACQDLHDNLCNLAIVGGVNAILDPALSISFSQAGMLSPEGKCQVFDAKANGYVRSEGCGVVVLKRLQDAQRDNDNILAVIQSAAVNSDGHSNGITAPNPQAQRDLIEKSINLAGLTVNDIDYIETHGTGTSLGDPIEFSALQEVFASGTRQKSLYIGSVKSNIGHLEAAAGMAGLIKTILMLQYQQIPANLYYKTPNPLIDLASIPAQVPASLIDWEPSSSNKARYAGVSSFGFTGTNAHVILSENKSKSLANSLTPEMSRPPHLFVLSGQSKDALMANQKQFLVYFQQEKDVDLASLCYSLAIGRSALNYRLALSVKSSEDLIAKLKKPITTSEVTNATQNKVAFLFTGQGSQYTGMGKELYQDHPLFKEEIDKCCKLIESELDEPLTSIMFEPTKIHLLEQTKYMQPALFVLQYAIAKLWISWGIQPEAVIGHSLGEYVAAVVAGVMSLPDGLKLIVRRAKLMQAQQAGSMLVVMCDSARAKTLLDEFKSNSPGVILNIAALNSIDQIVFSGEHETISKFKDYCHSSKIITTRLVVSHAFHSELMRPMLEEFRQIAESINYSKPIVPLISNINGKPVTAINADYWVEHVISTVLFSSGIQELFALNCRVFIEMGPQPILLSFAKKLHSDSKKVLWLPSLQKNQSDWDVMTESLASLYTEGIDINWHNYNAPFNIKPCTGNMLPTYPFQRQSYWIAGDTKFKEKEVLEQLVSQGLYKTEWELLPKEVSSVKFEPLDGKWLIFITQDKESLDIVEKLTKYIPSLTVVALAPEYQEEKSKVFLNASKPEDFINLLSNNLDIKGVIYLWGLLDRDLFTANQLDKITSNDINNLLKNSCAGLFNLVQALIKQKQKPKLFTVTRANIAAQQGVTPFLAPLVGMGKTLILEHPEFQYQHLDLEIEATGDTTVVQIYQLVSQVPREFLLAYKNEQLYVQRLAALPTKKETKELSFINSTYIITGGLGGIGFILCKWLIHQNVTSIILLGRRPFTKKVESQLNSLKSPELAINYYQADVSDYNKLKHILSNIQDTLPPIKGIFHASGLVSDASWENLNWDNFEKIFYPKVHGSWNLHQLSLELMPELEHFVMFSSISSLLGSLGQTNYAAANAFLDNLAHYRLQKGLPALSINFGPWQQVGMTRDLPQIWLNYGICNISEKLGLASLSKMMTIPEAQLCFMPNKFSEFLTRLPSSYKKLLANVVAGNSEALHSNTLEDKRTKNLLDELKHASPQERVSQLSQLFTKEVCSILRWQEGIDLPMETNLLALGMDSVLASELLHQLRSKLSLEDFNIQNLLFEQRSISNLIDFINEKIGTSETEVEEIKVNTLSYKATNLLQLSVQQAITWKYLQAQPNNPAYLITNFFKLEGPINPEILEKSIQQVLARHSMLRCSFHLSLANPFQFCHDQVDFQLNYCDISKLNAAEQKNKLDECLKQISHHQFDFTKAPLLSSSLFRCANEQYIWGICISHLLVDGASSLILLQEIIHLYAVNYKLASHKLKQEAPFQDFIAWQLGNMVNGTYEKHVLFWRKQLGNYHMPTLPVDKVDLSKPMVGAKEVINFPKEIFSKLLDFTKQTQVTPPNLLLTAYGLALAQFAAVEHAFITVLGAGREKEAFQATIGDMSTEIPLISYFSPASNFIEVAKQLQNKLANSFEHQYLHPEQMGLLDLPVPEVSFDFQHLELKMDNPGFSIKPFHGESNNVLPLWGENPRKISLKLTYNGSTLSGYLKYRTDLYLPETISSLGHKLLQIVNEVIGNREITCSKLDELTGIKV